MGAPAAGAVILVPFPFSDLSRAKLRPALVLADAGRADWILCQITSRPYADPQAVTLRGDDFLQGSLAVESFVRPGKLFTAHESLFATEVGRLRPDSFSRMLAAVVRILSPTKP